MATVVGNSTKKRFESTFIVEFVATALRKSFEDDKNISHNHKRTYKRTVKNFVIHFVVYVCKNVVQFP